MFELLLIAGLLLPLPLLAIAWTRPDRLQTEFFILSLSSTLLLLSFCNSNLKIALLGEDYSHRLFTTIGVNLAVASILAILLAVRRRWIGAAAAMLLAAAWLLVGGLSSAV